MQPLQNPNKNNDKNNNKTTYKQNSSLLSGCIHMQHILLITPIQKLLIRIRANVYCFRYARPHLLFVIIDPRHMNIQ